MSARPWMPWYIADFVGDTQHLDAAETGAYMLLLGHYWLNEGKLPEGEAAMARVARMTPAQWKRSREALLKFFPEGHNKRADEELAHAAEVSSKRRASAKQKHSNSSANAPAIAPANAEQLDTHARASPQSQSQREDTPSLRSGVSRARRGTRLPDDWQPSLDEIAFARSLLPEPQVWIEVAKFRDYWHARAGPQAVKRDWTATWRNWIRTAAERNPANGQGPNGKRTVQQAAADLVDRIRDFDEPAPTYLRDGTREADVRLLPPRRCE